ncbi:MAG: 30S ribosome-binding factor RbfA [Alphaproteobacteria bacterium]|nr:30S ribosome-binding factor RbfA [Alphaproteobacteria bacterium]MBO7097652.1 30S ribosome-binding factor RbfA [Alphaproteobacteria bacterium]
MADYKEPTQRQLRVAQEIKRVIVSVLEKGDLRSEELRSAFITVTEVRVSPDLKYVSAYVMTLNGKNLGLVLEMLNEEKGVFKKQIASKLQLRYTPDITFRADDTFVEIEKIEKLLRHPKVARDLQKKDDEE